MIDFTPLSVDALEFRLVEDDEVEPDWFVARMRDYIALEPDGCFALVDNGRPRGMVTTTCYQKVGWIGWLYVAEAERGKGLGEKLMRQALGYCITRGLRSIVLVAVVEAVSLYRRCGFKSQFQTQHFVIQPDKFSPVEHQTIQVHEFTPEDLPRLQNLDNAQFSQDRFRHLEVLTANPNFAGWVAVSGSQPVGYLFSTATSGDRQVGPLVVDPDVPDSTAVLSALLSAALDADSRPMIIRTPLATREHSAPLVDLGAVARDYYTERMFAGEPYPVEGKGIFSLGCPGKG